MLAQGRNEEVEMLGTLLPEEKPANRSSAQLRVRRGDQGSRMCLFYSPLYGSPLYGKFTK